MNREKALRGAEIIVKQWAGAAGCDRLLIVTDAHHREDGMLLKDTSEKLGCETDIMVTQQNGKLIGMYFDENPHIFSGYDCIISATDYSLVTTMAAKNAINCGCGFLSLPMHTNDGRSMLEYDFLCCNTTKSKLLAEAVVSKLQNAKIIHVATRRGTDMYFYKDNRNANFFNGNIKDSGGYSSASVEVYVPIEENRTHGKLILDGSLGYIGKVTTPLQILFSEGRITEIEDSPDGKRLKEFIEDYNDEKMYTASEFGIGLNPLSLCEGNCYIEDESALGTFHIGFGRNLALGGRLQAKGHFDLTSHRPDIYADGVKIMHNGEFII